MQIRTFRDVFVPVCEELKSVKSFSLLTVRETKSSSWGRVYEWIFSQGCVCVNWIMHYYFSLFEEKNLVFKIPSKIGCVKVENEWENRVDIFRARVERLQGWSIFSPAMRLTAATLKNSPFPPRSQQRNPPLFPRIFVDFLQPEWSHFCNGYILLERRINRIMQDRC